MTIIIDPANPKIKISSLNKGLVGHWPLDQESFNPDTKRFTDKSAYSNHGTGHGTQLGSADPGFQADRMGQLVRACPFNGSDDYVDCGNNESLNTTGDRSISAWFKTTSANDQKIVSSDDGGTPVPIMYNLDTSGGLPRTQVRDSSGNVIALTSAAVNDGQWHHFGAVLESKTLKLYIDGIEKNSDTDAALNPANTITSSNIYIGQRANAANRFNGPIGQVRIYNRAISQQEITLLYEQYRPKLGIG